VQQLDCGFDDLGAAFQPEYLQPLVFDDGAVTIWRRLTETGSPASASMTSARWSAGSRTRRRRWLIGCRRFGVSEAEWAGFSAGHGFELARQRRIPWQGVGQGIPLVGELVTHADRGFGAHPVVQLLDHLPPVGEVLQGCVLQGEQHIGDAAVVEGFAALGSCGRTKEKTTARRS
jgi:hypothetical protein